MVIKKYMCIVHQNFGGTSTKTYFSCYLPPPPRNLQFHCVKCVKSTPQLKPRVKHLTSDSHVLNIWGLSFAYQLQQDTSL